MCDQLKCIVKSLSHMWAELVQLQVVPEQAQSRVNSPYNYAQHNQSTFACNHVTALMGWCGSPSADSHHCPLSGLLTVQSLSVSGQIRTMSHLASPRILSFLSPRDVATRVACVCRSARAEVI